MSSDAKLMQQQFKLEALQATKVAREFLDDLTYEELMRATEHYLERAFKAGERRAQSSLKPQSQQ